MAKSATAERKKQTKKDRVEVDKNYVDRIEGSDTFESHRNRSARGNDIIRMKIPGQSVRGYLGKPYTNLHEASTYPIRLVGSRKVVEIPTNRQLSLLVKKGDCIGQLVEIEYRGRQYMRGGHYRKIYRLYKIKLKGLSEEKLSVG